MVFSEEKELVRAIRLSSGRGEGKQEGDGGRGEDRESPLPNFKFDISSKSNAVAPFLTANTAFCSLILVSGKFNQRTKNSSVCSDILAVGKFRWRLDLRLDFDILNT